MIWIKLFNEMLQIALSSIAKTRGKRKPIHINCETDQQVIHRAYLISGLRSWKSFIERSKPKKMANVHFSAFDLLIMFLATLL